MPDHGPLALGTLLVIGPEHHVPAGVVFCPVLAVFEARSCWRAAADAVHAGAFRRRPRIAGCGLMLTLEQAVPIPGAIMGAGGVSGIKVAAISTYAAIRQGRKPAEAATITITGDRVGAPWDSKPAANSLGTIAYMLTRLVAVQEIHLKHELKDTDISDRLEFRVERLTIDSLRAAIKEPSP